MIETRNLQKADHGEIVSVADDWWGHRVSEKLPRLFFKYFRDTSFVLEDDGRIFAFLIGLIPENQKEAYIHFAGVHPEYRKNGLAKRLYEKFFEEARKKRLRQGSLHNQSGQQNFDLFSHQHGLRDREWRWLGRRRFRPHGLRWRR